MKPKQEAASHSQKELFCYPAPSAPTGRRDVLKNLTSLETLRVSAVILDPSGTIVGVNSAWKEFGSRNGLRLHNHGLGANYLDHCADDAPSVAPISGDLCELLAGRLDLVMHIYPCNSPHKARWFMMLAFPLALDGPSGIAILHAEISSFVPSPVVECSATRQTSSEHNNHLAAIVGGLAETVESSVTRALASQLQSMLNASDEDSSTSRAKTSQSKKPSEPIPGATLTKRQLEVLRLLGEGKTNVEIARALCRSPNTIKLHVSALLRALNLKSRTEAALLASKLPFAR